MPHAARVAAQLADPAAHLDPDLAAHMPGCEACRGAAADAVRTWPVVEPSSSSSLVLWLSDPAAGRTVVTSFQAGALAEGRTEALELGPYLLLDRIDAGGMGEVFRAWHRVLLREDAVKMLRTELAADPDLTRRFFREAEAAARLRHPNVVTVYTADRVGTRCYLAMELVTGTDLDKLVRVNGPLPVGTACEYTRQAAEGLEHAFRAGLVHRDVKPANLLVTADGRTVKVADFGLARALEPDGTSPLTQARTVIGTADFMAPEQANDSHAADARSDVYALGCTLYFLLTGQVPFPVGGWRERLQQHATVPPPPVRTLRPDVPAAVEAVVLRCMAKHPDERYQTPGALVAALAEVTPGGSRAATLLDGPPVSAAPPAPAPVGRRRVWLGAGAFALVAAGVVAVVVAGRTPEGQSLPGGAPGSPSAGTSGAKAGPAGSAAVAAAAGVPVPRTEDASPWKFSVACWSDHREHVGAVALLPDGSIHAARELKPAVDQPAQLLWESWPRTGGGTPTRSDRISVDQQNPETPILVTADGCYTSRFNRYEPVTLRRQSWPSADLSGIGLGRAPFVFALAASADGTTLVGDANAETGGKRLVVRWDAKTGKALAGWAVQTDQVLRDVSTDPTGTAVATATVEGRVLLFAAPGKREWVVPNGSDKKPDWVWSVAVSPDGGKVYTAHQSNCVRAWNPARDTPEPAWPVGVWTPNQLQVSPDGRWLAAVGAGVKMWDLRADPPEAFTLAPDLSTNLHRVAFSADGTRLVASGATGVVWVWELKR